MTATINMPALAQLPIYLLIAVLWIMFLTNRRRSPGNYLNGGRASLPRRQARATRRAPVHHVHNEP